jgi:alkylglycerol monooxygenase
MIMLEVTVSTFQEKDNYDWPEMLSNMACTVVQQIGDAAVNLLLIPLYIVVQQSFGLINFGESFVIFILFFIIKDFMYYWVHRAGHENSFLWGDSFSSPPTQIL